MIPTPLRLSPEVLRIFVTTCDAGGIGRPAYIDVSVADPLQMVGHSKAPLLDVGDPGSFDENGVLCCSVVHQDSSNLLMYYVGFELGTKIRYRLLTGLARSNDGGETFARVSATPILERSDQERLFRCGPFCILKDGLFRLWYVAGSSWSNIDGKLLPNYDIRYAESADGMNWPRAGEVQIAVTGPDEHGFGRPWVIEKPNGGYRMFYSVRRKSFGAYRLGYAESADGRDWTRMDQAVNLDVSPGNFDSEAIMYAAPIQLEETVYLFYNGNDFGRDGIGVARLEAW